MSTSIGLNYRSPRPQEQGHPVHRVSTLKSHPATKRGGSKVKGQSKVLPCVFTGSDVSTSPQRLWPGAQWTITVQGPKKGKCLVYGVQQAQTAPRSRQGERTKRPPLPSPLGLRRGQGPLRTSGRASRRTPGKQVPVNRNTRSRKRQYVDAGPPCQRRTRWLAGPASVTT